MTLRLSQQGLLLICLPLAVEFCLLFSLMFVLERNDHQVKQAAKAQEVVQKCNHLYVAILNSGATIAGVLTTSDENYLQRYGYEKDISSAMDDLKSIQTILGDNSPQVTELRTNVVAFFDQSRKVKDSATRGTSGLNSLARLRPLLRQVERSVNDLLAAESPSASDEQLQSLAHKQNLWIIWTIVAVVLNTVLAVALWIFFNRSATKRFGVLMDNSFRLASDMPLNEQLNGSDEFAKLDSLFHQVTMALKEATTKRKEIMEMVAHDLRSPLMSVQISLQMLAAGVKGPIPDFVGHEVVSCENTINRMLKLIEMLLDIEMITSGNMPLTRQNVSLVYLIDRSVESVQNNAVLKGQTITYPDEAPSIFADPDRMEQVLMNLLSNAIKFAPKDSEISITASEVSGNLVEVRVIDRGRGIQLALSKKLFSRYEQASVADRKTGKGLGLAICKAIIDAHSGMIGVESEVGVGSQFWFRVSAAKN